MSLSVRIIPCLDVDNGRVVKGINFKNLTDAGDPVEMAKIYNSEGADELTFLDISASSNQLPTTLEVVQKTAEQVFIPLTVGGGVRSVNDVDTLLRAGADKVSINTAAINRPQVIAEIAQRFGQQVLVLSVDAKRGESKSGFEVTTHGGKVLANLDAIEWVKQACELDADGTKAGFDLEMIKAVRAVTNVPLIASGGAGKLSDFEDALKAGANALLAASVFHFGSFKISDVKSYLSAKGYPMRTAVS